MIRFIGAALLMAGCGGFGFSLAAAGRRELRMLKKLRNALQEMQWELRYRMTELPELCAIAADAAGGAVGTVFRELSGKLARREAEDVAGCLNGLLSSAELPRRVRRILRRLGESLGRFDLEGQLQGLEELRLQCSKDMKALEENASQRFRNYQTLALCAGAALAILLI